VSDITKFSDALREEIAQRTERGDDVATDLVDDLAVAATFIDRLEETAYVIEPEFSPYCDREGRNRCQFTGTSYIEEEKRLIIFVGHSTESSGERVAPVSDQTLSQLYGRSARFLSRALNGDYASFRGEAAATDAARHVFARRSEIESARVLILTNGRARSRDFEEIAIEGIPVECDIVDIDRLYRITQEATSRADIVIDFVAVTGRPLSCLEMKPRSPDYETYLTIFSGDLIYSLYERFGQRLFEFNVRSYLQAKGKVNKGIRDTLKNVPTRFLAYNNGIVATADSVEAGLLNGELCITKLSGLQIVNGAQTTASIYRARKIDKIDLTHVAVATKITRVQPANLAGFVPLISQFANTQNSVHVADLSANSEFHIALERLSQITWCPGEASRWFYERARGSYEVAMLAAGASAGAKRAFKTETPLSQRINKTDIAKYWLSAACRPHTVSMGAQKSFANFMAELPETFPPDWTPDAAFWRDMVSRAIIFRSVEKVVRFQKFSAYRANIVAYSVAHLFNVTAGEVRLRQIWDAQRLSAPLEAYLPQLTKAVDEAIRQTAGARNVTEWCKKQDCWDQVRTALPALPSPPPEEFNIRTTPNMELPEIVRPDPADVVTSDIEQCMELDAAAWSKICHWAQLSQRLTQLERSVCRTLMDYADRGWSHQPSVKQAKHGLKAIELAREAGILTG
jgi:hypothetical protein